MTLHLPLRTPRRILAAALGLSLAVGLTACGSDDDDPDSSSTDVPAASEGYYPHTQKTSLGETSIKTQPERIIALSPPVADAMLALGVTPTVVATDPAKVDTIAPWIADDIRNISDADISVNMELNVEKLASLDPDLIIGMNPVFKGDDDLWKTVNSIAPTIIPETSDTAVPWETTLRTTAEALGLQNKAEEVIDEVKGKYKSAASDIPSGTTYNYALFEEGGFAFGNGSAFEMFGLTPSTSQVDTQVGVKLSAENTDQLTGDLLVVWAVNDDDRIALDQMPAFQALPAVKSGNVYYTSHSDATAIAAAGPNSLLWLLERITPTIEKLK